MQMRLFVRFARICSRKMRLREPTTLSLCAALAENVRSEFWQVNGIARIDQHFRHCRIWRGTGHCAMDEDTLRIMKNPKYWNAFTGQNRQLPVLEIQEFFIIRFLMHCACVLYFNRFCNDENADVRFCDIVHRLFVSDITTKSRT